MKIAKQKRNCPTCKQPLTGLIRKICMGYGYPAKWGSPEQTDWLCEYCDQEFVQVRGKGIIPVEQWYIEYGEDGCVP